MWSLHAIEVEAKSVSRLKEGERERKKGKLAFTQDSSHFHSI